MKHLAVDSWTSAWCFDEHSENISWRQVLFTHSPMALLNIKCPSAQLSTLLLWKTATRWQHFSRPFFLFHSVQFHFYLILKLSWFPMLCLYKAYRNLIQSCISAYLFFFRFFFPYTEDPKKYWETSIREGNKNAARGGGGVGNKCKIQKNVIL